MFSDKKTLVQAQTIKILIHSFAIYIYKYISS